MRDDYGRDIRYLRLSVTDRCNCRCVYCMPENGVPMLSHAGILSFEEMRDIVAAAASLGVRKVRLEEAKAPRAACARRSSTMSCW